MLQFQLRQFKAQQHLERIFASRRLLALTAGLVFGCIVLFTYYSGFDRIHTPILPSDAAASTDADADGDTSTCFIDLDILRHHASITNSTSVQYARLNIAVTRTENFTGFPDSLDLSIPSYRPVALDDANLNASRELLPEAECTTPSITIQAPYPAPRPDASHLLFGLATTPSRLNESVDAFAHWAAHTNATIIAVVNEQDSPLLEHIQARANTLGVLLTILPDTQSSSSHSEPQKDDIDRYFSLIQTLHQHHTPATKWAILIDDETFFPSMHNLLSRLESSYDASIPQYIGGMTEDLARLSNAGYMAYSGAGIFLSTPLLTELQRVYETCRSFKPPSTQTQTQNHKSKTTKVEEKEKEKDPEGGKGGDRLLATCIYTHTRTKFTWERGLHQLDIRGDASGFFESGRPLPLSVHHWRSWFDADMVALAKVAAICGEECLLRRWHLSGSRDWFLVNGYSVIQDGTVWNEPRPMEQTWEGSRYDEGTSDPFAYSLGPLRRRDPDKVSFRLREAVLEEELGRVRQVYVLNGTSGERLRVLEVVWTLAEDNALPH